MWYFLNTWKFLSENPQLHPKKTPFSLFTQAPPKNSKKLQFPHLYDVLFVPILNEIISFITIYKIIFCLLNNDVLRSCNFKVKERIWWSAVGTSSAVSFISCFTTCYVVSSFVEGIYNPFWYNFQTRQMLKGQFSVIGFKLELTT